MDCCRKRQSSPMDVGETKEHSAPFAEYVREPDATAMRGIQDNVMSISKMLNPTFSARSSICDIRKNSEVTCPSSNNSPTSDASFSPVVQENRWDPEAGAATPSSQQSVHGSTLPDEAWEREMEDFHERGQMHIDRAVKYLIYVTTGEREYLAELEASKTVAIVERDRQRSTFMPPWRSMRALKQVIESGPCSKNTIPTLRTEFREGGDDSRISIEETGSGAASPRNGAHSSDYFKELASKYALNLLEYGDRAKQPSFLSPTKGIANKFESIDLDDPGWSTASKFSPVVKREVSVEVKRASMKRQSAEVEGPSSPTKKQRSTPVKTIVGEEAMLEKWEIEVAEAIKAEDIHTAVSVMQKRALQRQLDRERRVPEATLDEDTPCKAQGRSAQAWKAHERGVRLRL
ncbi:hypothetical protein BJ878DRAFT_556921 [Calycina marina]|uniref:Uncharacterized protein n=1 Tax=Calycina marina TaxID=1763456 RepID=A0A9P7YZB2_9HELO|nr:hypothetical protein BJ878DRAFT_556921 [Calycina marina]